jgi:uncharacterized membrane protein YfcA
MGVELYIFAVLTLSGFLQTVTGFGFALITAPLLALVLGAKETVMLVVVASPIISILIVSVTKRTGSFKAIRLLATSSVAGAIPGAYALRIVSGEGLKIFMGIVLLLVAIAMWHNRALPLKCHKPAETAVGWLSGFLAATTGIPGPPVVLYYLEDTRIEKDKTVFRANLARYFLLINIATITISYSDGTLIIKDLWGSRVNRHSRIIGIRLW